MIDLSEFQPNLKFSRRLLYLALVLIATYSSIRIVKAGTVQEVLTFGKATGRTLHPGIHLIIPLADSTQTLSTKKVIYETTSETKQRSTEANYKDFPVDTNTNDGQQVDIFYTVRFSVDPSKSTWVVQNIGSEDALVDKIVKTESRIWARNIPRNFTAEALYTGSGVQQVQAGIEDKLRPVFEQNGLLLDAVGIREIKFTDQYIKAIEAKQIEQVNIETEKNRAQQEVFRKEQRITKAEGQATEQSLQRQTLTDQLLRKMWIEKWDGQLPQYIAGDAGNIIQIPAQ